MTQPHRSSRLASDQSRSSFFEPLEKRVFLSATGIYKPPVPTYEAPTSTDLADVKNGPMANSGPQLINLYREYRKFRRRGADANFDTSLSRLILIDDSARVGVTIRGRGTFDALVELVRASGGELIIRNPRVNVLDAWVPIGQLHSIAADPSIVAVNPIYRPVTHRQGSADNQADRVQRADQVREVYGLDGTGVTVGVLSDSVNKFGTRLAGSVATGDLPANINIINDSPLGGSDEGRAMLELIHDIAPKAGLAFATADLGMQTFADNIRRLYAAGAEVIVDDIGFPLESWFQPSIIDRAITDVVTAGAVYFSSAGNSGPDSALEGPTNFARIGRDRFVDFDPGAGVDTRLRLTSNGGGVVLQWDNPYDGVVGEATSDLDIYVYETTYGRVVASGTANALKNTLPVEFVGLPAGTYDIEIRLADFAPGATLPTYYRMLSLDGLGISSLEHGQTTGSIDGHAGGENTISVGAVPFFFPSENEPFSSTGPITRIFDAQGGRLPARISLQKPDISGIDNVNTSFFGSNIDDGDSLPNFSGTSAAAPNVAAVAALFKQADPGATRESILAAFQSTAIPLNGSPAGTYDPQGGFGLIDALGAAASFIGEPTAHIVAVKPDPTDSPVESIKIVFTQRVSGLDISDLTLTRDNGPNLLTGDQSVRTTDNGRSYLLRNLSGLTDTEGTYRLTLNANSSGIQNSAQQPFNQSVQELWQKLPPPTIPMAPSNLLTKVISGSQIRLRWTDNATNEDGFSIQRADDANFTTGVVNYRVPANATVFTDNVPVPAGKHYFYRVRAFNDFSGFSSYSNASEAFAPVPGEIVLDDAATSGVRFFGEWFGEPRDDALGFNHVNDGNAGKGEKSIRFLPTIQFEDDYFVYARWTGGSDRATNVLYDVFFGPNGTQRRTITVNQRDTGGNGWVLLGKFRFTAGNDGFVRIRNFNTDGFVSVDAMRFLPASGR